MKFCDFESIFIVGLLKQGSGGELALVVSLQVDEVEGGGLSDVEDN